MIIKILAMKKMKIISFDCENNLEPNESAIFFLYQKVDFTLLKYIDIWKNLWAK